MAEFVCTQEVQQRKIKGVFRKFAYFCNGHKCYVYCERSGDFLKLINTWNLQGRRGEYVYYYESDQGESITLVDIPADQGFKVKLHLQCPYTGVWYIQ